MWEAITLFLSELRVQLPRGIILSTVAFRVKLYVAGCSLWEALLLFLLELRIQLPKGIILFTVASRVQLINLFMAYNIISVRA